MPISRASLFGEATQCVLGVETDQQTPLWVSFVSIGPDYWCLLSLCWHLKYLIQKCSYSHDVCCFFGTFYPNHVYKHKRGDSVHQFAKTREQDGWHLRLEPLFSLIKAAKMEDMDNTISFVSHFIIVLDYANFLVTWGTKTTVSPADLRRYCIWGNLCAGRTTKMNNTDVLLLQLLWEMQRNTVCRFDAWDTHQWAYY